ncbi:hypothetical protein LCGC14_1495870 [marine sediment metagenome]|uniref:Uncharacterized protein n=1 Tax=marine sediment metagenome TaxID=412755 RepID=A0A0F9M706_9ZZZZ
MLKTETDTRAMERLVLRAAGKAPVPAWSCPLRGRFRAWAVVGDGAGHRRPVVRP